ncbi:hypothetical protein Bra3105_00250 [Brachybacterium halotolerans subsp. kimchii]|uniref:hypothetical protein n=1 Tax=Brachybacterium halotolerans TaxID=2795215 RepID=UPI001E461256|nr:hypothetical protein [Brachybacterium halotolerans]UEJ82802.1 hypothetical protein Bra3105_00250 [Brachybacterium halotolerans subsp. kimchii]
MGAWEATVEREGRVWRVSVPALGISDQVARLGEADVCARELVAGAEGVPAERVEVRVRPLADPGVLAGLAEADAIAAEAAALVERSARMRAGIVRSYVEEQHLTYREAARLLGISMSRVQQLVTGR